MEVKKKEIIVGHQPQYFPYLGIFSKIIKSDVFIFVDSTKFVKKVWHNRTLIKDNKGNVFYFTIPVKTKGVQKIKDVKISDHVWKNKHLKSIMLNYRSTRYFDELYPDIEKILNNKSDYLIDYTLPSMHFVLRKIGFPENKIFRQSSEKIEGSKNQLIVNITKHFKSNNYLSGEGSKDYIDEDYLLKKGIVNKFNVFSHPKYFQQGNSFVPNLSVIDCIFNIGYHEFKKLINKN